MGQAASAELKYTLVVEISALWKVSLPEKSKIHGMAEQGTADLPIKPIKRYRPNNRYYWSKKTSYRIVWSIEPFSIVFFKFTP